MRKRRKNAKIVNHAHSRHEFVYFFSGTGIVNYEENVFNFSPGSYYFVQPDTAHDEFYHSSGQSLVIHFDTDKEIIPNNLAQNDFNLNLYPIVENIKKELQDKLFGSEIVIQNHIIDILIMLCRQQRFRSRINPKLLENSIAYIDEYYMTSLSLKELAAASNYSKDYYRILFERITGKTPKDYIITKRINLAKKQLKESKFSINEISQNCGFEFYSHFAATFKNKTGQTPAEYRKEHTQKKAKPVKLL